MKFDELYNQVFLAEQITDPDEIPTPDKFDDVEPAPLPGKETALPTGDEDLVPSEGSGDEGTIRQFMDELEQLSDKLNGVDGNSLQQLLKQLDKPGTPFEGIAGKLSSDVTRASEILLSISEQLKTFIISAAKVD